MLKDDSLDKFSDYCFRDSFEHSSSESQLIDSGYRGYEGRNPSHRSSRSQTPLSHSQVDGRLCPSAAGTTPSRLKSPQKYKKFNVFKTFVPTFLAVTAVTFVVTVVVLECDIEIFRSLKSIPELVSLKYHFYEPVKQYLKEKFSNFFAKSWGF